MTTEVTQFASFERIRYAQCWEDADVLLQALTPGPGATCLSIASAGDNTLALVGSGAKRVIAVDLSPAQIACLELRSAAYRRLSHAELLELLGVVDSARRPALYRRCRGSLSSSARQYWDGRERAVSRGIATVGKFERYLAAFRRFVLPLVHSRATVRRLFELETEAQRRDFYEHEWNNRRWDWLCRLFFSRPSLGRLGRDPGFSRYADEPVWANLRRRIPNALVTQRPADNPYLQWILSGRYETALPYALRPENFERIRANLDALECHCGAVDELLDRLEPGTVTGFNLSDIFEYMSPQGYEELLRKLVRVGAPGSRLVYWNLVTHRERPESMRYLLESRADVAAQLHAADKAFFYRRLVVEEVSA